MDGRSQALFFECKNGRTDEYAIWGSRWWMWRQNRKVMGMNRNGTPLCQPILRLKLVIGKITCLLCVPTLKPRYLSRCSSAMTAWLLQSCKVQCVCSPSLIYSTQLNSTFHRKSSNKSHLPYLHHLSSKLPIRVV
jgi:hypothetical protein